MGTRVADAPGIAGWAGTRFDPQATVTGEPGNRDTRVTTPGAARLTLDGPRVSVGAFTKGTHGDRHGATVRPWNDDEVPSALVTVTSRLSAKGRDPKVKRPVPLCRGCHMPMLPSKVCQDADACPDPRPVPPVAVTTGGTSVKGTRVTTVPSAGRSRTVPGWSRTRSASRAVSA